jgi:DNA repair protein SbcD/Mre11
MDEFKFLHMADIHLDSPLLGLSKYEGVPVEEIRLATRTALTNTVDLAIEEKVEFVVISGDIYDGDWPHFGTGLFFCSEMGRLEHAGIEVFLLYGNHDAESVLTKKLPLPDNVHTFSSNKAHTIPHKRTGTAVHGRSYKDKDTRDNLASQYPEAVPGVLNIGMLHTALSGRPPHAPYAPCSVAELAAKGYQYWALGHVHDFEIVSTNPYIVFPGNLQGRTIREAGGKGAVLVTVTDGPISIQLERRLLDSVRWFHAKVDLTGVDRPESFNEGVRSGLEEAIKHSDGLPTVVRLSITGITPLHSWLMSREDQVKQDVRAIAVSLSKELWVERVSLKTSPTVSIAAQKGSADELHTVLEEAAASPEFSQLVMGELADFMNRLPADLTKDDGLLRQVRDGNIAELISNSVAALSNRLEEDSA